MEAVYKGANIRLLRIYYTPSCFDALVLFQPVSISVYIMSTELLRELLNWRDGII